MKPPKYEPIQPYQKKSSNKLLVSHTITPEEWGSTGHYAQAAMAWRTMR